MINKVLVANRGEIAIRIMRACRESGIATVAVYSEADRDSIFVKYADEACSIGPAPARDSYLNIPGIIKAALNCGAQAIHPGYGFLAENSDFARACEEAGIIFIGPSSRVLELVGCKTAARTTAQEAGIEIVPGINECTEPDIIEQEAEKIGYPVIIKPCDGGGGIGMQVVKSRSELKRSLEMSSAIASRAFGRGKVYVEKYLEHPRHIEVQILADSCGNIIHLGERECSIQRMHNKLVEEAPSPVITPEIRQQMGRQAVDFARKVGYLGAGTVEFIYSGGRFYFIEMNARIQVEHTVTEMVTGIDIVKEQLRIAGGLPLSVSQQEVKLNGWSIECRINAEDPLNNFTPSPGRLSGYRSPGGIGIRVDSGVYNGFMISPYYHPMISKLVAWGRNREEVILRMRRALYEYIIVGVKTNIILHKAILENPRFVSGDLGTHFIGQESSLFDDMRRIEERDRAAVERLKETFKT
ncbi:MAG: acetyl-CoA carboxylase biotin carboxylase subunit [Dehalococcoidaceae bacterium]|nr:acetyl-CoA carboxylase biotin carboxylase subunit [Dehalococcoidaceae bacterium]